jgi:flagellar motility protein MotE (MotC chaperone)
MWTSWMWPIGAGLSVIIALSWTTVQLVHASAEQGIEPLSVLPQGAPPGSVQTDQIKKSGSESPTTEAEPVQGPALTVPEEMIAMFLQRRQDLERRESAVREAEAKLVILKAEVEQILSKIEAVEQRRLAAGGQQPTQGKPAADIRAQQLGQLVKMYESMPAEEAAARIERMTNRKALEILRLLKSKSAGAILAQVKVDRAAKLSEEFLTIP